MLVGNTTPLGLCSFFIFYSFLSILEFPMFLFLLGIYVATVRVFILSMFTEARECQVPGHVFKEFLHHQKEMKIRLCLSLITDQLLSSHCCSQYPQVLH